MTPPLLDIANLKVALRGRDGAATPVLRGVDLSVAAGQVRGLVGESGAGKSMIARAVLGILPASARIDDGSILFERRELLGLPAGRRRRLVGSRIALIPQDPLGALNPTRRIGAQLDDVLRARHGPRLGARDARRRALALLEQVQLREPETLLRRYPFELSGGMRQRVLIAAAFAAEPRLIVADEPTTALDVTVQRQILQLIRALQRDAGTALLFVTHDLGVVAKLCDQVSVLRDGAIVEQAAAAALFERPRHDYTRSLLAATPRFDRGGGVPR